MSHCLDTNWDNSQGKHVNTVDYFEMQITECNGLVLPNSFSPPNVILNEENNNVSVV